MEMYAPTELPPIYLLHIHLCSSISPSYPLRSLTHTLTLPPSRYSPASQQQRAAGSWQWLPGSSSAQPRAAAPPPTPPHQRHQEPRWLGSCSDSRGGSPPPSRHHLRGHQETWCAEPDVAAWQCSAWHSWGEGGGREKGEVCGGVNWPIGN